MTSGRDTFDDTSLLSLLRDAASHYRSSLLASPGAIGYLKGRHIEPSTAARFGLGFSGSDWHGLDSVFSDYSEMVVAESGLRSESGVSRFHNRVMFPIKDLNGQIVGFGGRVIEESLPKYLNSPDSYHYKKGQLLYGLYEAQEAIKDTGLAVVVEGYLDVITLAQSGLKNVVGVCGTAFTEAQLKLLMSQAGRIVFCFDGDDAGYKAAASVLSLVLPFADDSVDFRFILLPGGYDPDSLVQELGLSAFKEHINRSLSVRDYIVSLQHDSFNLASDDGIARSMTAIKSLWVVLPDGQVREDLLDFVVGLSGLTDAEVLDIWGVEY